MKRKVSIRQCKSCSLLVVLLLAVGLLVSCTPSTETPITPEAKPQGEPTAIFVDSSNAKVEFKINSEFDSTGLEVTVCYDNDDTETVPLSECTFSGFDSSTLTTDGIPGTITITWKNFTAQYSVYIVEKLVTKIEVTTPPDPVVFKVGITPRFSTKPVITATYEDNTTEVISNKSDLYKYDVDASSEGKKELSFYYHGYKTSCELTYETGELDSITLNNTQKVTYYVGEYFDYSSLLVTAMYADGTVVNLLSSDYKITGFDSSKVVASQTITVSFGGLSTVYDITIKPARALYLTVETQPTKKEYKEGDSFDPTGMVVIATYSDNSKVTIENDKLTITPATFTEITDYASVTLSITLGDFTLEEKINDIKVSAYVVTGVWTFDGKTTGTALTTGALASDSGEGSSLMVTKASSLTYTTLDGDTNGCIAASKSTGTITEYKNTATGIFTLTVKSKCSYSLLFSGLEETEVHYQWIVIFDSNETIINDKKAYAANLSSSKRYMLSDYMSDSLERGTYTIYVSGCKIIGLYTSNQFKYSLDEDPVYLSLTELNLSSVQAATTDFNIVYANPVDGKYKIEALSMGEDIISFSDSNETWKHTVKVPVSIDIYGKMTIGGFTPCPFTRTTKTISNDVDTLGVVATSCSLENSSNVEVTLEDDGIKITSLFEETAYVVCTGDDGKVAKITVTVSETGDYTYTITKAE